MSASAIRRPEPSEDTLPDEAWSSLILLGATFALLLLATLIGLLLG